MGLACGFVGRARAVKAPLQLHGVQRLVQAAAGAVIDSLQNIQKNPQNVPNAVKGALDTLKSILPGR